MVRKVFNVNQQRCFSLPLFVRNKTLYGMPCLFRPLTLEKKKKKDFELKAFLIFSDGNQENKFRPFSQVPRLL